MFYTSEPPPAITLSQTNPAANISIMLREKGVIVKGKVIDALTGSPLEGSVRLWRISDPRLWLEQSLHPEYLLVIPAGEPIGMEVTANGYAPWSYPGDRKPGGSLTAVSGQTILVDVKLIPLDKVR